MAEIADRKSLEAWLEEKPREIAVAIAARAALRSAPLLVSALDRQAEEHRATIVLPSCRAMAVASFAGKWPKQATEVRISAASPAADAVADAAAAFAANADAIAAAAFAADTAFVGSGSGAVTVALAADASDRAASAFAWEAVSHDIDLTDEWLDGDRHWADISAKLSSRPLWHGSIPTWAAEAWEKLKAHPLTAGEGWEVWTRWYDGRLEGRPGIQALDLARATIPDEDWKKGPAHVNAIIARLIEKHRAPRREVGGGDEPGLSIDAALETTELRAAEADFEFDSAARLMRMVPFAGDVPDLDDPAQRRALENMLSELAGGMGDLAEDAAGSNARASLLSAMRRYAREAARPLDTVRPGRLWDIGATLQQARLDEDVRLSLEALLVGNLERMVDKHLDLMRVYLSAALARARQIDTIDLAEGFDPEAAVPVLDATIDAVARTDPDVLPQPDPEIVEVMRDRVDELRGILDRIHRTSDPRVRRELEET